MTFTQQAIHILKKDVWRLRWEIAGLLCLNVLLVWYWTDSWSGETNDVAIKVGREFTGPFLAVIWFLIIARLLHAEPLAGDRHFWLTRPYSRSALLFAKGLFMSAFLLLPLFIAQVLAVLLSGLRLSIGALLVNLFAVTAVVCFPAAAVAAFTSNLWQYVLLIFAGSFAVVAMLLESNLQAADGPVPVLVGAILLGGASVGLLFVQYRGRRTLRNAAAYVAACATVWLIVAQFPRDAARAAESALDGTSTSNSISFSIAPPSALPAPSPFRMPQFSSEFRLPIQVFGADPADLAPQRAVVTLRTASGRWMYASTLVWPEDNTLVLLLPRIPGEFLNDPVSLDAEFWVKRFEDLTSAMLPADGSAVVLDGREQCRLIRPDNSGRVPQSPLIMMTCRQALWTAPWHEREVLPVPNGVTDSSPAGFSRVVIPTIDPIKDAPARIIWIGDNDEASSDRPRAVVLRERVAFFRATLEAENLRLADYVMP